VEGGLLIAEMEAVVKYDELAGVHANQGSQTRISLTSRRTAKLAEIS
jgi:hypothetical protein